MSSSSANLINIGSGWFDAFRDNGGPVLYSSMNRTPAIEDIRNILIYISFSTFFVAFLIIFPGIRKERCSTFICVTTSLFIGAVILISNYGSNWHVAKGTISGPYRAFSKEKIYADIGVHIGLDSVNITLKALPIHQRFDDINYNERFYWIGANQMKQEFQRALVKGLPYPILTISEYLSHDGEGFNWGRHYRLAGYYTSITLWLAFASWILMNILLCAVPRYGAYTMQLTGALMLLSNLLYISMIPGKPLRIPFEGTTLTFSFGLSYWLVFVAGLTSLIIGATVSIVDILFPNKFSTILEVDYDTPYRYFVGNDIHIIGSLPPPNGYYYHGQGNAQTGHHHHHHHLYLKNKQPANMHHYSALKTASNTTNNSSCCAGSNSQLTHRIAAKTKSDASTSTRDDSVLMDHNNNNKIINDQDVTIQLKEQQKLMPETDSARHRASSNGHQIIVTNVQIESNNNNNKLDGHNNNNNDNYLIPMANNQHQLESIQRNRTKSNEQMPISGPFTNGNQLAFENQAYEADIDVNDDVVVVPGGNLPVNSITVTTSSGTETDKSDSPPLIHHHNLYIDDNESLLPLSANIDTGIDYDSDSILQHSKPLASSTPTNTALKEDLNNNNINVGEFILTTPKQLVNNSSEDNDDDDGEDADDDMDDENESDVSTTIIDGKRAISLSNFGKFAEQLEKRETNIHNRPVINGPTFGYPLASAGYMKNAGFAAKHHNPKRQHKPGVSSAATATGRKSGSAKKASAAVQKRNNLMGTSMGSIPSVANATAGTGAGASAGSSIHHTQKPHSSGRRSNSGSTTSLRVDLSSSAAMW